MPINVNGLRHYLDLNPASGLRRAGSSRLVPQCGRPAWQISHIASTLAASGPAVRRSLQGTPVQAWTRVTSNSSVRVGHRRRARQWRPVPACGQRAVGPGYQTSSKVEEGLVEAAGLEAGCHGSICMHLSVSLPYLYVYRMYLSGRLHFFSEILGNFPKFGKFPKFFPNFPQISQIHFGRSLSRLRDFATYRRCLPAMRHHPPPHGGPWVVAEGVEGVAGRRRTCGTIPAHKCVAPGVVSEVAASQTKVAARRWRSRRPRPARTVVPR